jgi:hypothetical protein
MSLFQRVKYAMYLFIAITMALLLLLSIAEGLGVTLPFSIADLPFHSAYFLPMLALCLAAAPRASSLLPLPGQEQRTPSKVPYLVRADLLALLGLSAVVLVNIILWLAGAR